MKILGLEIKRASETTEPNLNLGNKMVSIQESMQKTLPSIPLSRSIPRAELGDSGTRTLHGIITEEYNSQLQGIQGIKVYDEMRKSDGTVRAAILACTLPILRANWFVNPATASDQDKEIANFVEHALFDWVDIQWESFIRQALLMVPFGVMVFEKVYGVKEHEGKSYVTISKLAPRLPKSILQWELPDRTFGIQQIRQDGVLACIPGSKLLVFVNELEGTNWWGNSMIRPAYKHWYFKNNFYKLDAIAFERQGIGIPHISMPKGYTDSDEKIATNAAKNLRGNEQAYILTPDGYTVEFMDMKSHTTRDPEKSINHHNKEILQSVLAQFLELGSTKTGSGSHALSQDHSDLFLKGIEAIANTITGVIKKDLIKELVDLNFNDVKAYPVLDYSGIIKADVAAVSKAYSDLVTAGGVTPVEDDEQYFRTLLGLPARTQDQLDEETDGDPSSQQESDHADIEDVKDVEEVTEKKGNQDVKTKPDQKKKTEAHDHAELKRKFDDGKGFMSWRQLTFAEKKVSWGKIQNTMDDLEKGFSDDAKKLLNEAKDAFMAKLHDAIDNSDLKAIQELEIGFVDKYKSLLKDTMRKAYEYGKNNVSAEMGVLTPPNTAESLAQIALIADSIANKTLSDLETRAKLSTANALKQNTSTLQAVGSIDKALEDAIDAAVDNAGAYIINQSINNGRNDVFERHTDEIYALQRSEILDKKTCNFCLSMDGLVIEADDDWATTDTFHSNCRGIWVEILKDEQNPPAITGVPQNIADYYGGQTNDLLQPPRAITRPGTPADEYVKKQEAAKKNKKK